MLLLILTAGATISIYNIYLIPHCSGNCSTSSNSSFTTQSSDSSTNSSPSSANVSSSSPNLKSQNSSTSAQTLEGLFASYNFSDKSAISFYKEINTSAGLLTPFPQSNAIYLADDQALNYYSLLNIYNSTRNPIALSLADEINSTMNAKWGGLFKYWNPVFVILRTNETWITENGSDRNISTIQTQNGTSYLVKATIFSPNPNFNFTGYVHLELYYCIWNLHVGNYSAAKSAFQIANSYWNGSGFKDRAFIRKFTSYKLAVDFLAWKALESNANTTEFADGYQSLIQNMTSIMSKLHASDGGVWTNYEVGNGRVIVGSNISLENGETTSLFVLAMRQLS